MLESRSAAQPGTFKSQGTMRKEAGVSALALKQALGQAPPTCPTWHRWLLGTQDMSADALSTPATHVTYTHPETHACRVT